MRRKAVSIVGARPNFIKLAALQPHISKEFNHVIVHTGQHYDVQLSKYFFDELIIPEPNYNLGIGSGNHGWQTGTMLVEIEKVLSKEKPKAVIVYGDTNSTLAGALSAVKLHFPVVHIEGGERIFVNDMPEEINRKICDHISDVHCCATRIAVEYLRRESITQNVFWTGDVMLDLLKKYKRRIKLPKINLPSQFILITIHRPENTDNIFQLKKIITQFKRLNYNMVWPMHPRTRQAIIKFDLILPGNIKVIPPVSYLEMLGLESKSFRIITDSGGVQKEAYWLGIPCITILKKTSWKQTLHGGWNQLVTDLNELEKLINIKVVGKPKISQFGDGKSAQKIVKIISDFINNEG